MVPLMVSMFQVGDCGVGGDGVGSSLQDDLDQCVEVAAGRIGPAVPQAFVIHAAMINTQVRKWGHALDPSFECGERLGIDK